MSAKDPIQIVCLNCLALNRVPSAKLHLKPLCGKCKQVLMRSQPTEAADQNIGRIIEKSDLPVVVDFWAPWCGPCKQFAPVYQQTAEELAGQFIFIKVNTEANQQSAMKYQIRSIPTLAVFSLGREVDRLSGALPKVQFQQWLEKQL